ncbi:penicillin-binding protein 1A [Motiliproteus sp. SC1-56]|uniref:penicillin-binding protein 1A n=1 Tax=Motiliproteus sp. SC1-56 TaxID=2799565 RepID=UPI00351C4933
MVLAVLIVAGGYFYLKPGLPDVERLRDIQLQTPLRIYSQDAKLIAEFGEKRRTPIDYEQIPERFIQAILAAEDSRFFDHPGVDIKGLARAAFQLVSTGRIQTGGSTITMQVAKNYFLTRERTFVRKFSEILLALQIEQELTKEEILELYVNKIYLGNRAYGIQAAANVYYGRDIDELTLAELAMIAGLPKAPSAFNPLANPERALERRNWILSRMRDLGFIEEEAFEVALQAPVSAEYYGSDIELSAPYAAEMVRAELQQQYGDRIYTDGFRAYTTLDSTQQAAANQALVDGLLAYERRHGYRGPEKQLPDPADREALLAALAETPNYGSLVPAVVLAVEEQQAQLLLAGGSEALLAWEGMSWARPYIDQNRRGPEPKTAADILAPGDLVRVRLTEEGMQLNQVPTVQGALTALSPRDGAIRALVGGFNFAHSKFNRVTQGTRQPGSNFKPFIYSAALANGFTPATLINDAPVVFEDSQLESQWRPENYSRKFYGPTRLREALYKSRNLVSIRILRRIGIRPALGFVEQFGFDPARLPANLSLALGSADVTPLELATGYATFANQGFKVDPYLIARVEDVDGSVLYQAEPATVCDGCRRVPVETTMAAASEATVSLAESGEATEGDAGAETDAEASASGELVTTLPLAPRIVDPQTVYLINNIMQDVIKRGTGRKAKQLGRSDLAGKTGTTNDQKDAWFSGFNQNLVASVWVGFDQPKSLGRREFGSTAALPIWIDFMEKALAETPETPLIPPEGIVSVRIDPKTGLLAAPGQDDAIFEVFREGEVPEKSAVAEAAVGEQINPEQLF